MRIVHVNPYHYPYMGGIEHRIHNLCKRLAARHEVTVVTSRLPGTEETEIISGYEVRRLPSRFIDIYNPPYVSTKGILATLENISPDIVDFHYRWSPSYTRDVIRYDGAKVHTSHNVFGEGVGLVRYLSYLNDMNFRRKIDHFDHVVCISEFIKRELLRRGYDETKMTVIPNGVEIHDLVREEEDYILSLGRLVRTKGLRDLINAMPDVGGKLLVAGAGPERKELERLSSRLNLEDKVQFLGKVNEERKAELFAACKFFVMPSTQEAYGIAAAEAMSFGKTLVCTNVGGLPEVVQDCGLMVSPDEPRELAMAMNRLLDDVQLRSFLGNKAKERARSYTWERLVKQTEAVYELVLQNRKKVYGP
jgi:glycosyltransferase involved in cell wall biosynthesis